MKITCIRFKSSLAAAALLGAFCASGSVSAATSEQEIVELRGMLEDASKQLADQRNALVQQEKALAEYKRELAEQKRMLETLQSTLRSPAQRETARTQAEQPAASASQPPSTVGRAPESEPSKQPQTAQAKQPAGTASQPPGTVARAPESEPPKQPQTAQAQQPAGSASQPSGPVGRAPESEPPKQQPLAAVVQQMNSALTPKSTLVLEPSLQYAHTGNNRVGIYGFTILPALTLGIIDIRTVSRDTFFAALTARYGLTNRMEVEAKLPYVLSYDTTVSRPQGLGSNFDEAANTRGNGIGDIELAARYQFNDGLGGRPIYIGNLRVKTRTGRGPLEVPTDQSGQQLELPTGSGFWAFQPSLTAIFPSDPAVFFGNVSYTWNVKRDLGSTLGEVDPGDAIGFNFGMGLALNEKASFSLGYDHSIVGRTSVGGSYPPASATTQVGSLTLGYSYRLGLRTSLNLSLAAGVTDAAPNVQLMVRLPISF